MGAPRGAVTFVALLGASSFACTDAVGARPPPAQVLPGSEDPALCAPGEVTLEDGSCDPAGIPPDQCGAGMIEDGARSCLPVLPAEACGPGTMAVLGDTTCTPVAPCGTAPWGDIPIDGAAEHVDASYPGADSDGSAARPWLTIGDAIAAAADGALVAVAPGSYVEDLVVDKTLRIWGMCPDEVEIVGGGFAALALGAGADSSEIRGVAITGVANALILSGAEQVLVENVWIHDAGGRGVVLQDDFGATSATIRHCLIEGVHSYGIFGFGSGVEVEATSIRDIDPDPGETYGMGIGMTTGDVVFRGSIVERAEAMGIFAHDASLTIESSLVRDVLPEAMLGPGRAIELQNAETTAPRTASMVASIVSGAGGVGIVLSGSQMALERTVVRATQPDATGNHGRGIEAHEGPKGEPSTVTLVRCVVEQNLDVGMMVAGSDATVDASIFRDTQPERDGLGGGALNVEVSPGGVRSRLLLRDSLLERNTELAVFAVGSDVELEDTLVRDVFPSSTLTGAGLYVQSDATTGERGNAIVRRSAFERCTAMGLLATAADLTIEDTVVRDVAPDSTGHYGRGIQAQYDTVTKVPASLTVTRSLVERAHEFGVILVGSTGTLQDVHVRDTLATPADGLYGDGVIVVARGGVGYLTIAGSRVEGSARAGIATFGGSIQVGASTLECNAIDLDAEVYQDQTPVFQDMGKTVCGCGDAPTPCIVVSTEIAAPSGL